MGKEVRMNLFEINEKILNCFRISDDEVVDEETGEVLDSKYLDNTTNERKVIDYIAGMTDAFLVSEYNKIVD